MTVAHSDRPRCRAHNRLGASCSAFPIHGGSVCIVHGGGAPQVKKAAEDRIRELVDPALNRLAKLIEDDSSGVALGAVKDILDRAGYKPVERIQEEQTGELNIRYVNDWRQ
jgi:hypothetical protein